MKERWATEDAEEERDERLRQEKRTQSGERKPVSLSPLAQLPTITRSFAEHEEIIIMTANESNLKPMNQLIKHECGIDLQADRYKYVGMEDIPGFEAIHDA